MTLRNLLTLAGLGLALLALTGQLRHLLDDRSVWPPDDFVEYWAAGRLNLDGQNPYSPELLLPLEREAGRDTDVAVMMWNPPWTLTVVMPLGALPPRAGQVAWLMVNAAAVALSAVLLWRVYGGRPGFGWVAIALAVTFVPTLLALQTGQISGLLLLGTALLLGCDRNGFGFAAGAAAVLLAIKPHLVYLFWLAVALDAVIRGRWAVVAGGVATGLAATAVPLALNPDVFAQYLAAFRDHPPAEHVSLTIGTLLRIAFGEEWFRLQFVSVVVGVAWYLWHRSRRPAEGSWANDLPWLLLVSFVTAPYGAWHFDLVLLLAPVIRRAAQFSRGPVAWWAVAAYVLANLAMLGLNLTGVYSFWFGWVAPFLLLLYAATDRARTTVTPA